MNGLGASEKPQDSITFKAEVVDLAEGRCRGAVRVTRWKAGSVSTFYRYCPSVRQMAQQARDDAQALEALLRGEALAEAPAISQG